VKLLQIPLVIVAIWLASRLVRGQGARTQAMRRLGMLVFAAVAILSILMPGAWTWFASLFGIGRGADLILYLLVVAFVSFTVTTYQRFRALEVQHTKLARRIALDEAPPVPADQPGDADGGAP